MNDAMDPGPSLPMPAATPPPIPQYQSPYDPKPIQPPPLPEASRVQERLTTRDAELVDLRAQAEVLFLQMLGQARAAVDAARVPFRSLAIDDVHNPKIDLAIRKLWTECEWLMQDAARLYGERFYVGELPPTKATIKGQMRSERM